MKKILLFLLAIVVLMICSIVGIGFLLSPQDPLELGDVIIVISGGETEQRVAEGVKLYQDGWAPLMIMSGAARDEGIANAVAMKQIAVIQGVVPDHILVEEEAVDTFGNAVKTREIIEQYKLNKIILVTSPYHQRRAALVFKKVLSDLPVKIINHSASDSAWRKNGWWFNAWARQLTLSELKKVIYSWIVPFQPQE